MTTIAVNPNSLRRHPVAPQYRYSHRAGRYIDAQGRFVPVKTIRDAVDTVIAGANRSLLGTAKELQNGKLTLAEWQMQTAQQLKLLHVANGLAAVGGLRSATQVDYGRMGQAIKQQYRFLNDFAKEIANGKQLLDSTFLQRVQMYGDAGRGTYHNIETASRLEAGFTKARRVLGFSDHCKGCISQAGKGWQPIEEVAPIGSLQCLTNCHCSIEYS